MGNPRFDVTTFGEVMLRLSVPPGRRLETATQLDACIAGAETNVVSLLSRLERKTCWVGALPKNPLGFLAANHLRSAGVDLDAIIWSEGGRLGTYFVEFGGPPRGVQVTYDRAGSVTALLSPAQIDWDALTDSRLLHMTGITPALSESCREIAVEALGLARQRGVPISFDINYRQKLWTESRALEILLPMIQDVEILLCSRSDAMQVFGCGGATREIAEAMRELSRAKTVVITLGPDGAALWNGKDLLHEPAYPTNIVDRLGAGDALAAGILEGWLEGGAAPGLRYGVTLAALALSQFGDMVSITKPELAALAQRTPAITR